MEIESIGYNHSHDSRFVIDRPYGLGNWLFLLIKTPAVFMQNGKETPVKKNSFILYSSNTPQFYRACEEVYTDDWFHFNISEEDEELIKSLEIPLNTVTELGDIEEFSSIVRNMTYEFYSANRYRADITELYMKMLFLKLSNKLFSVKSAANGSTSIYYDRMQNLRNDIYNNPCEDWSIDMMAEKLFMSRSGFQHTYKKIFGTNVMNDVVSSRLQRVRFYLSTTNMTLGRIAEQSGYSSEIYMMRQFKERYGVTPTQYRSAL